MLVYLMEIIVVNFLIKNCPEENCPGLETIVAISSKKNTLKIIGREEIFKNIKFIPARYLLVR